MSAEVLEQESPPVSPGVARLVRAVERVLAAPSPSAERDESVKAMVDAALPLTHNADTSIAERRLDNYLQQVRDGSVKDEDPAGMVAWLCLQTTAPEPEAASIVDRMRARLLTAEQLKDLPRPEWIIDGLVARNSLGVLYGKPGGGKSFVLLDWACSVATGSWWFGRPVVKGPVLYIVAEGAEGMSLRLEAWKHARRTYHLPDELVFYPEAVNLLHVDQVAALASIASELDPALIIVDTLSRSMAGGDENSPKDMGLFVDHLDTLRRATAAGVMTAHHGTKNDGSLRGHTALEGAAHTVIECKGAEGAILLTTTKQKDAAAAAPIRLHLVPALDSAVLENRPALDAGEPVTAQARQVLELLVEGALEDGLSTSTWCQMAVDHHVSRAAFYKHRKTLVSTGLVHNIGSEKQPRYTPVTSPDAEAVEEF